MEQSRSITFIVPGTTTSPSVEIQATEAMGGRIDMTVTVLQTQSLTADLRGLFFNVANDAKLPGLAYKQSGNAITDFDTVNAIQLKGGANMQGVASPFDVGLEFGTSGIGKDDIKSASFSLANDAQNLTLDDIAQVTFGVRLTGIGSPTDGKRGEKDGAKLLVTSPAAPLAGDDAVTVYEDGASGLSDARSATKAVVLNVLANDSDADADDTLSVVEVENGAHGVVTVVDGPDADALPGDAVAYTPHTDFSGTDSFSYRISDGHGGFDTARVDVTVVAVADVPAVTVEVVDAADAVNQVRLKVTALQTDDDGSEHLTGLVAGSLPAGVSITPASAAVVGAPGTLTQEFMVTLPADASVQYTQLFTATSRENSNADIEAGSGAQEIRQVAGHHDYEATLSVDDASLWANGTGPGAAIQGPFLGIEVGPDITLPVWPLYYTVQAQVKIGFQPSIQIEGGTIDAELTYDVNVDTVMNVTTDTLTINTSALLTGGSFQTQGPGGAYHMDLVAGYDVSAKLVIDFDTPDIDLLPVTTLLDTGWHGSETLVAIPVLNSIDAPIQLDTQVFGTTAFVQWADVSMHGQFDEATQRIKGAQSDDFMAIDTDVDAALFGLMPVGGLSAFDVPLYFNDGVTLGLDFDIEDTPDLAGVISLLDLDVNASLGLKQELEMSAKPLTGHILFENGVQVPFTFGADLVLQNAAATYDALDKGGNGNGIVEFQLVLDGGAQLHNVTSMSESRGMSFDLLKFDFDADLDYGVDSYNGPIEMALYHTASQTVALTGIADQAFDLAFGAWTSPVISTQS